MYLVVRLEDDLANFSNLKLKILAYEESLPFLREFSGFLMPPPPKDKLGVDEVYLINLARREDRRKKMEGCFSVLGIDHEWVKAVDGKLVRVLVLLRDRL
jgi:collagen beta-1,O-galactosyltransferase